MYRENATENEANHFKTLAKYEAKLYESLMVKRIKGISGVLITVNIHLALFVYLGSC